jgi:tripartite-type tricarboxylate transporter receptor subunit TctC
MCKKRVCFILTSLFFAIIIFIKGYIPSALSQEKYPTRPIDIIVPFSPGASTDLQCRLIANFVIKKWGVPINVINKPGGNSVPGCLEVYKANPDGYTLLGDGSASSAMLIAVVKNLPFKVTDRTFIATMFFNPNVLFSPVSAPFNNLAGFIALAKKNPENITWAFGGTTADLPIRQLFKEINVDISKAKTIVCKGGAEAVTLASGGHVMLGGSTPTGVLASIKSNLIRGILVTSQKRVDVLPDVPTSAELGYPKITIGNYIGISGPPNLPSHIVEKWEKVLQEMINDQETLSRVKGWGAVPFYNGSHAAKEFVVKQGEEYIKALE